MPYLTRQTLRDATSNLELAQVCSPRESTPITAAQMALAIDGQPADWDGDPEKSKIVFALARLDAAITNAQAFVDSFLFALYDPVPLPDPPAVLVSTTVDVARYQLANVRTPEEIRDRYTDAVTWLKLVAKGDVALDAGAGASRSGDSPDFEGGSSRYSVDGLEIFANPIGAGG